MAKLDWDREAALRIMPLWERLLVRWHVWRCTVLDRKVQGMFVGDAGYALSDMIKGGALTRTEEAATDHARLAVARISPYRAQCTILNWHAVFPDDEIVSFGKVTYRVLGSHIQEKGPVQHLCIRLKRKGS